MLHSESPIALRFTQAQVATIVSFNNCDPCGFYIGVVAETPDEAQIAEVWRHDPTVVLFFIMPLPSGDVGVYDVSRERYESGPLTDVLASIIEAASIPA